MTGKSRVLKKGEGEGSKGSGGFNSQSGFGVCLACVWCLVFKAKAFKQIPAYAGMTAEAGSLSGVGRMKDSPYIRCLMLQLLNKKTFRT
ncbi:MAG: hypothetical protein JNL47_08785 [Bacteroidia bacterium]|nr:hypothetical protein [Bacteroidia bacterium]